MDNNIQSSITKLPVNTSSSMVQVPFNVYSQGNYFSSYIWYISMCKCTTKYISEVWIYFVSYLIDINMAR